MATLVPPVTLRGRWQSAQYKVGNQVATLCDSRFGFLCSIAFAASLAGCTEFLVHEALASMAAPEIIHAALDAFLMGLATALITSLLLLAIRERHRRMLQEMERVAELNHAVR